MPDGHEVVVSGHFFDTQRKAKRGLIKAWAEQVGLPPDLTYGELSHMFAEQVREDVAMIQITTYLLDRGVSWSRVLDWWSRPCVDMPDQTPRWLLVNYGPERAMVRARMDATALGAKRMEAA